MKKILFPLFVLALLGVGCAPSPQKKVEVLQQEVITLHDSAMAKMGALYTGRKELTYLKDSVVGPDTLAQRQLTQVISDLVRSDEKMMQWMRSYRNPENKPAEEALTYLQQEKEKIEHVRQDIQQSLQAADALRSQYRNNLK